MDNKDMPAQPVPEEVHALWKDNRCRISIDCLGLTKREELAARMLPEIYRGYLHDVYNGACEPDPHWKQGICVEAFRLADTFFQVQESLDNEEEQ